MSTEPKHHYLPVFYLKQWAVNKGRLVEYSRQGKHKFVTPRSTSPKGTGYVRGLNLIPGAPPDVAEFVEKEFLRAVDDWAARALVAFLEDKREPSDKEKVGWARFLYSMIIRTPEHLERIRQKAPEFKLTSPPQALLPALINSNHVVKHLASMAWHTADFSDAKSRLLTSDRPIIMTNGLSNDDAHIALPISPTRLFIAVRRAETLEKFKSLDLVEIANHKVAEQAVKYVYGIDDSRRFFIAACVKIT